MRGFKDFFHETNDIALAIVIVLLADWVANSDYSAVSVAAGKGSHRFRKHGDRTDAGF